MYSYYPSLSDGIWRVDVTTERGAVMGRTKFRVKIVPKMPELVEDIR
jgi:hypothetical protein